jgi:hypothetical protein
MQNETRDREVEQLLEAWAASQPHGGISPELARKVHDALKPSLTPVKPIPAQNTLVVAFLIIFLAGSAALASLMNKSGLHEMTPAQIGAVVAICATAGILLSVRVTAEMIPGAKHNMRLVPTLILCGVGALVVFATLFPWQVRGDFVATGWPCAITEITIAVPAAVVLWLLARRGALFASAGLGAALASLAVFLVVLPLQTQCMFLQAPHLLVWHGGTAVVLVALGALIGALRRHGWHS